MRRARRKGTGAIVRLACFLRRPRAVVGRCDMRIARGVAARARDQHERAGRWRRGRRGRRGRWRRGRWWVRRVHAVGPHQQPAWHHVAGARRASCIELHHVGTGARLEGEGRGCCANGGPRVRGEGRRAYAKQRRPFSSQAATGGLNRPRLAEVAGASVALGMAGTEALA